MIQVVTIDGPAGAGKSTVARLLADRLGWKLLDTGAMYRVVALAAIRRRVDLASDGALGDLVESIDVKVIQGVAWLDGEDVADAIRSEEVTRNTRHAADSPRVRARLVGWQRDFARDERRVVTEGRDQGTIVFPDAFRKFFLVADDLERARRRHAERLAKGAAGSLDDTLREVRERDEADRSRAIAPLKAAEDAQLVDSTGLDLEDVVTLMETAIRASASPQPA